MPTIREKLMKAIRRPPQAPVRVRTAEVTRVDRPSVSIERRGIRPPVLRSRTNRTRQDRLYRETVCTAAALQAEMKGLFRSLSDLDEKNTPAAPTIPEPLASTVADTPAQAPFCPAPTVTSNGGHLHQGERRAADTTSDARDRILYSAARPRHTHGRVLYHRGPRHTLGSNPARPTVPLPHRRLHRGDQAPPLRRVYF